MAEVKQIAPTKAATSPDNAATQQGEQAKKKSDQAFLLGRTRDVPKDTVNEVDQYQKEPQRMRSRHFCDGKLTS